MKKLARLDWNAANEGHYNAKVNRTDLNITELTVLTQPNPYPDIHRQKKENQPYFFISLMSFKFIWMPQNDGYKSAQLLRHWPEMENPLG